MAGRAGVDTHQVSLLPVLWQGELGLPERRTVRAFEGSGIDLKTRSQIGNETPVAVVFDTTRSNQPADFLRAALGSTARRFAATRLGAFAVIDPKSTPETVRASGIDSRNVFPATCPWLLADHLSALEVVRTQLLAHLSDVTIDRGRRHAARRAMRAGSKRLSRTWAQGERAQVLMVALPSPFSLALSQALSGRGLEVSRCATAQQATTLLHRFSFEACVVLPKSLQDPLLPFAHAVGRIAHSPDIKTYVRAKPLPIELNDLAGLSQRECTRETHIAPPKAFSAMDPELLANVIGAGARLSQYAGLSRALAACAA
ncbi:MAG: hypothetical protein AAFR21_03015 [Pseudomonadota bacterium]